MPRLHDNIEAKLTRELIIDPEFKELIPPLTAEEYSGLEQSIIAEGCREPIITWDNIIIDGHNSIGFVRLITCHIKRHQKSLPLGMKLNYGC